MYDPGVYVFDVVLLQTILFGFLGVALIGMARSAAHDFGVSAWGFAPWYAGLWLALLVASTWWLLAGMPRDAAMRMMNELWSWQ